jgi:L-asparaginase II
VVFYDAMQPVTVLVKRGGILENEHRVRVAVWRRGSLAKSAGDVDTPVYLRSSAKPVQAMACVLAGAADRFAMTDAELALACGSHGGEGFHVETAGGLLAKIGRSPSDLQCGAHAPSYEPAARAIWSSGGTPTVLHNNCSGKHSAMLAACVASGWDLATYLDPDHPLQVMNRGNVAALAGVEPGDVRVGVDGCSAPVFAVPLAASARIFATLTNRDVGVRLGEGRDVALRRICAALRERPEMIAGTGRIDSDLIRATKGRLVSKVGAEALWCVGVVDEGLGLAVKCDDGHSPPAHWVGLALLRSLGVLSDAEWTALAPHHDLGRRNHRKLEVGSCEIVLPAGL